MHTQLLDRPNDLLHQAVLLCGNAACEFLLQPIAESFVETF